MEYSYFQIQNLYSTYTAGKRIDTGKYLEVYSPIDGSPIALVSMPDKKHVKEALKQLYEKGRLIIYGGKMLGNTYIELTLIEIRDKEKLVEVKIFNDEVFAPVAVVTPIKNVDEALKLLEKKRYGLDAIVFGRSTNEIRKLIRYLEVGAIYVNEHPRHGIRYYPFRGVWRHLL